MNGGDTLARGAKSAQFTVSEGISQDRWDKIFENYEPAAPKIEKVVEKKPKLKSVWSR